MNAGGLQYGYSPLQFNPNQSIASINAQYGSLPSNGSSNAGFAGPHGMGAGNFSSFGFLPSPASQLYGMPFVYQTSNDGSFRGGAPLSMAMMLSSPYASGVPGAPMPPPVQTNQPVDAKQAFPGQGSQPSAKRMKGDNGERHLSPSSPPLSSLSTTSVTDKEDDATKAAPPPAEPSPASASVTSVGTNDSSGATSASVAAQSAASTPMNTDSPSGVKRKNADESEAVQTLAELSAQYQRAAASNSPVKSPHREPRQIPFQNSTVKLENPQQGQPDTSSRQPPMDMMFSGFPTANMQSMVQYPPYGHMNVGASLLPYGYNPMASQMIPNYMFAAVSSNMAAVPAIPVPAPPTIGVGAPAPSATPLTTTEATLAALSNAAKLSKSQANAAKASKAAHKSDSGDEDSKSRSNRNFPCTFAGCSQIFSTRFSLKRHIKKHSGDRPFACTAPGCERRFAEKSTLTRHLRTHTGEKPYRCKVDGCGKTFADRTNVKRHYLTHFVASGIPIPPEFEF